MQYTRFYLQVAEDIDALSNIKIQHELYSQVDL